MVTLRTTALLFLLAISGVHAQTTITGGPVSGIWNLAGSPYIVQGDVTVSDVLVIDAGVLVLFQGPVQFKVYGTLLVNGLPDDSVHFTIQDTTGYHNGAFDGWKGFKISLSIASAEFHFAKIEYSMANGIQVSNSANLKLFNSEISLCQNGIVSSAGIVTMDQLSIHHNRGDGISLETGNGSPIILTKFAICNNEGVGINCGFSTFVQATGGLISGNRRGIFIDNGSNPVFQDVEVLENKNPLEYGGGAYCVGYGVFQGCKFEGNMALQGGGLFSNPIGNEGIEINDCEIIGNIAIEEGGGVFGSGTMQVLSTRIVNNEAYRGAGMYIEQSESAIQNSIISRNKAVYGGGLYANLDSEIQVIRSLVSHNKADSSGAGFYIKNSDLSMDRSTVGYNNSLLTGGGLTINNPGIHQIHITNSIFWLNQPNEITSLAGNLSITYSDILGGFAGIGNIDSDPLFADPWNNDFHLTWADYPEDDETTSPCIDQGNPASEPDPDMTVADMGAFYFEQYITTQTARHLRVETIHIFPNPVIDRLYLKASAEMKQILILNLAGQAIEEIPVSDNFAEYAVSHLQPGIYLVQVYFRNGEFIIHKLIKE